VESHLLLLGGIAFQSGMGQVLVHAPDGLAGVWWEVA